MIGFTKLLCGTATVSEVIQRQQSKHIPAHLLQFSDINRPLVVWNTTNRCNLKCKHCYIQAEDHEYNDELTTQEACTFIDDLASMNVPVLLFSGGEPIMRKDLYQLIKRASEKGLRPVISTNGTLITSEVAQKLKDAGIMYVGVSIDGKPETHDKFRNHKGAFEMAINGIRESQKIGLKTGIRITLTKDNYKDLPFIFDLVEKENIPRLCIYHLVYAGRAQGLSDLDLSHEEMRKTIEYITEKVFDFKKRNIETEVLTTDNHADGVLVYKNVLANQPERAEEVMNLLKLHGGCSAGTKFGNVDPKGNVHPCQFWQDATIGNVKEKPFSIIWNQENPMMDKLRHKEDNVKGKCGRCKYKNICSGCRIRAQAISGDEWDEDPACYLFEEEIK
ncbi:MAG: radical SAM protein [Caldisericia bacterium]|nr:radical SAM protein [Caldisericia bacterium]